MSNDKTTFEELIKEAYREYWGIKCVTAPSNSTRAMISIAASNLAIVEMLTDLLERPKPSCKCGDKPIPQYTQHSVPELIIKTLDLATQLIEGGCEGREDGYAYANENNLLLYGQRVQEIRNILMEQP